MSATRAAKALALLAAAAAAAWFAALALIDPATASAARLEAAEIRSVCFFTIL